VRINDFTTHAEISNPPGRAKRGCSLTLLAPILLAIPASVVIVQTSLAGITPELIDNKWRRTLTKTECDTSGGISES